MEAKAADLLTGAPSNFEHGCPEDFEKAFKRLMGTNKTA